MSGLPSVPKSDPYLESLKKRRDRFSPEWFDDYDKLSHQSQVNYNHYLLSQNPSFTYNGIVNLLDVKKKQANKTRKLVKSIDKLEVVKTVPKPSKPPTSQPYKITSKTHKKCGFPYWWGMATVRLRHLIFRGSQK